MAIGLPARIDRADVEELVARCLAAAAAGGLRADGRDLVTPGLPAVELLARLALAMARDGAAFRVEGVSPALRELLELCGLADRLLGVPPFD